MKESRVFYTVGVFVTGLGLAGLLLLGGAPEVEAKRPFSSEEAHEYEQALLRMIMKGDALWHDGGLGTNGLACGNCHPDGAAGNPHTFPKFQTNLGKVGTFREMINWCIMVPLQGEALPTESEDMIALEAYGTYMHQGVPIALGKDEQHGGNPVDGGPGYPMPRGKTWMDAPGKN